MRIGELARRGEVTVETVRYYERLKLLPTAERSSSSGYRRFDDEAVNRLLFIKRTQNLGFSLEEIRELIELQTIPDTRAAEIRECVEKKLDDVRTKIRELDRMAEALKALAGACDGHGSVEDCTILGTLSQAEDPST